MNFDSGGGSRGKHRCSFHAAPSGKRAEKVRRKLGGVHSHFSGLFHNYSMYLLITAGFGFNKLESFEDYIDFYNQFEEKQTKKIGKGLNFFIIFYKVWQKGKVTQ